MRTGWWMRRAGVSIGLGVFVVVVTSIIGGHNHHQLNPLGYLLLIAPAVVLLWRNRFPLAVFLIVTPLVGAYYVSGNPAGPVGVYAFVALFVLALSRGAVVAGLAAGGWFLVAIAVWLARGELPDGRIGFGIGWAGAVIAAGAALTARRNTLAARQEQAVERTRRMAEEERLRIAREVHDVVAHSLAAIKAARLIWVSL